MGADAFIQFLTGGILVAGMGFLATRVDTKWAALFWSLPITIIPVILMLHFRAVEERQISNFVSQSVPSMIVLLVYVIALSISMKRFNFWKAMSLAIIVYIIAAVVFIFTVKSTGKAKVKNDGV